MAATFAHIIVADCVCKQAGWLSRLAPTTRVALQNYTPFLHLGTVSPDCPYAVLSTGATGYANLMHYLRTADFVRYALPEILKMNFSFAETRACIAWIFGYAAHLVTDLTIHPVISRKFGAYSKSAANRKQHRLCELNQDVYLFKKLYGKEIVDSDFLKFSGLKDCSVKGKLSPAVAKLWTFCLQQYPRSETKKYVRLPSESLKPNVWYSTFMNVFQNLVTEGHLQDAALGYPRSSDIRPKYVEVLPTAASGSIDYDELFQAAVDNVRATWGTLAAALDSEQFARFALPNANLDTGLADDTQKPVFIV